MEKEIIKLIEMYFNIKFGDIRYLNDCLILQVLKNNKNIDELNHLNDSIVLGYITLIQLIENRFKIKINDDEDFLTIHDLISYVMEVKSNEVKKFIESQYHRKISDIKNVLDFIVIHTFITNTENLPFEEQVIRLLSELKEKIEKEYHISLSLSEIKSMNFEEFIDLINVKRLK